MCVCVLLGSFLLTDPPVAQFLKNSIDSFFWLHLPGRGEARQNVFVFVQKLSVIVVVAHGAVGLRSVGHQHQSAAARGAVEETLRTAVGQVVPQVRARWKSPVSSGFYLLFCW